MKKILFSVITIGVVAAVAIGASQAWFSDTEESKGNRITAGTIDLSVDNGGSEVKFVPVTISDMKPSYVRWTKTVVTNSGTNPLKLWKHIKEIKTFENLIPDAELDWYAEHNTPDGGKNDIDTAIVYDMYLGGTVIGDSSNNYLGGVISDDAKAVITEEEGITLDDIESVYIYLGELAPNDDLDGGPDEVIVWQSYHMKDDTENWAQGDKMTFDIEFYAEQVNGSGPSSTSLLMENKTANWDPILDNTWGILKWTGNGASFDYTFKAQGLKASTNYKLIYAPDPWPQSLGGKITEFGSGTTGSDGKLSIATTHNFTYDLPSLPDDNYPVGAKIWLVLASHHDGTKMTTWSQPDYLYEYNLIKYDDTDSL